MTPPSNGLSRFFDRWRRRGFTGPRYSGVGGRLRFLYQHFVGRTDIVLVARSEDVRPRIEKPQGLTVRLITRWEDFSPFAAAIDAEYHAGYAGAWQRNFGWGEQLALALLDDQVAGFGWVQFGAPEGRPCDYALLWEQDRRVLRVGVLPSQRGRGVNTRFYALLLDQLFAAGAVRILIDCARDNIPSLRAQIKAGFRPIASLRVRSDLLGGGVAWGPLHPGDLPPDR